MSFGYAGLDGQEIPDLHRELYEIIVSD